MFNITPNKDTIDNYKLNSCLINLFVDTWHDSFEKRKKDGKRMYIESTYESVCQIIGLTYKSQDIGASLRESVRFLDKFHFGMESKREMTGLAQGVGFRSTGPTNRSFTVQRANHEISIHFA